MGVIDDDQVREQVAVLLAETLCAYAEARTLLEVAPWSGSPYRREKPDGPMRALTFGSFRAVVCLILEQHRGSTCCSCSGSADLIITRIPDAAS